MAMWNTTPILETGIFYKQILVKLVVVLIFGIELGRDLVLKTS